MPWPSSSCSRGNALQASGSDARVDVSSYSREARGHAQLLLAELLTHAPNALSELGTGVGPVLTQLGIIVQQLDRLPPGCSVAGSSDHKTRTITVVRASTGRMRFTVLHELGHLFGHDSDAFQDAVYEHGGLTDRNVEEDACDAFAALLLLPDARVADALGDAGLSARGLRALIDAGLASREACAVAVAQRLPSPGYAMIIGPDGLVQFAARSGDVLPLGRGADQTNSDLGGLIAGGPAYRDRGSLTFTGGSGTGPLYLDAIRHEDLVLVVACESDPAWDQLQTPAPAGWADRSLDGHCDDCGVDFQGWQRCPDCQEPRHSECGRCACPAPGVQGERTCPGCFILTPPAGFSGSSRLCKECTG
jgi:hypothetical protein